MIEPQTTAVILLAAGRSSRFGAGDKLAQLWRGQPLGMHVAATLSEFPFARRIAVTSDRAPDHATLGYETVVNHASELGMSRSIRLGVEQVGADVSAVLIVLADMPRVTATHITRLFKQAAGPDTIVASSGGDQLKPPALFGAAHFPALIALTGDHGARDLLRSGRHVVTDRDELLDIDSEDQLHDLRARFGV